MKTKFQYKKIASLIFHFVMATGLLIFCATLYFYIFLPHITHHGEHIAIPDLEGIKVEELDDFLSGYRLRYEIHDSSYSKKALPLTVLQQFPKEGSLVKENRKIYVTINKVNPPTIPLPNLIDQSKINADAVLHSNNLQTGNIILTPSPFLNLIKGMRYMDNSIEAGTPVPKGAVIDLVVGDGKGRTIFQIKSLIGASYEQALSKLQEWNLNIGNVKVPAGIDTTSTLPIVYKQHPDIDELVHIGDPVDIWMAPAGYENTIFDEEE